MFKGLHESIITLKHYRQCFTAMTEKGHLRSEDTDALILDVFRVELNKLYPEGCHLVLLLDSCSAHTSLNLLEGAKTGVGHLVRRRQCHR